MKDMNSSHVRTLSAQGHHPPPAAFGVPDVGLGITFHEFVEIGPSFILPGDACTYTPVKFRYVFFCPIVDEILE
ncbi:RNA polymerase Rpb7 domain-containing protein, partial [Aphelenchoides avenae]